MHWKITFARFAENVSHWVDHEHIILNEFDGILGMDPHIVDHPMVSTEVYVFQKSCNTATSRTQIPTSASEANSTAITSPRICGAVPSAWMKT
jgi:hypothetical protein